MLLVARHADGDWSFACGHPDHESGPQAEDDNADFVWIGVGTLLEQDASLAPLPDLKLDQIAERAAPGSGWMTYPM